MIYIVALLLIAVISFGLWMYRQGSTGGAAKRHVRDKEAGDARKKVAQSELKPPPATDTDQLEWLHELEDKTKP